MPIVGRLYDVDRCAAVCGGVTSTEEVQGRGRVRRWRRGVVVCGVRRMNEVNARRARLVLGWVTGFGRVYHLGM